MKKIISPLLLIIVLTSVAFVLYGFSGQANVSLKNQVDELLKIHPAETIMKSENLSMSHLDNYKNRAVELHKEFSNIRSGNVLTTITFSSPVDANRLVDFISEYDIEPEFIYVYGKEYVGDGYVTGGLYFDEEDDLNMIRERVNESKKDLLDPDADFIGFLSVIGQVSSNKISLVQNDAAVYLADVSGDKYFGYNTTGKEYVQHLGYALYEINK